MHQKSSYIFWGFEGQSAAKNVPHETRRKAHNRWLRHRPGSLAPKSGRSNYVKCCRKPVKEANMARFQEDRVCCRRSGEESSRCPSAGR